MPATPEFFRLEGVNLITRVRENAGPGSLPWHECGGRAVPTPMSEQTSSDDRPAMPLEKAFWQKAWSALFRLFRLVIYLLGIAWAAGAVFFDVPIEDETARKLLAIGYAVVVLLFFAGIRTRRGRFVVWLVAMSVVLVPWLMIRPSNDRNWEPPWARTAWADLEGDVVTFHNLRNFDYALDGKVMERWEERTVHLSNLRGLDYFHDGFGGELLAHPILSFDFGAEGRVAFSIECRREVGEKFTPVGGLFKMFELSYLVGDERDFIRLRTNIRDEPVRLYRASYSEKRIREMFFETVGGLNVLKNRPRFYNSLTANCTTSYWSQAPAGKRARFDYRLLLNGKLESLLYERRVIVSNGLPLEELVERASINEAAKAAHDDPEFSARIRKGIPGFE